MTTEIQDKHEASSKAILGQVVLHGLLKLAVRYCGPNYERIAAAASEMCMCRLVCRDWYSHVLNKVRCSCCQRDAKLPIRRDALTSLVCLIHGCRLNVKCLLDTEDCYELFATTMACCSDYAMQVALYPIKLEATILYLS